MLFAIAQSLQLPVPSYVVRQDRIGNLGIKAAEGGFLQVLTNSYPGNPRHHD